jgi:hypothetical protein
MCQSAWAAGSSVRKYTKVFIFPPDVRTAEFATINGSYEAVWAGTGLLSRLFLFFSSFFVIVKKELTDALSSILKNYIKVS